MIHDKNTCAICGGRDWFHPKLAEIIDADILEAATMAHMSEQSLVLLHLARSVRK